MLKLQYVVHFRIFLVEICSKTYCAIKGSDPDSPAVQRYSLLKVGVTHSIREGQLFMLLTGMFCISYFFIALPKFGYFSFKVC